MSEIWNSVAPGWEANGDGIVFAGSVLIGSGRKGPP
jgi:hypothetical protein